MEVKSIKTKLITKDDAIEEILDQYIPKIEENTVLVITSKIISVIQKNTVPKDKITKKDLIVKEADYILETENNKYDIYITIKEGILIPSAGIDESNSKDEYILYPKNVEKSAVSIWNYLRKKHNIKNLGIIISDSHTTIMRRGVTGIGLSWCGFKPLYSYIGKKDLYGNHLKVTYINILDSLAVIGVFIMGEGKESTPIAVIKNPTNVEFLDRKPNKKEKDLFKISMQEDLYGPLLQNGNWISKKSKDSNSY